MLIVWGVMRLMIVGSVFLFPVRYCALTARTVATFRIVFPVWRAVCCLVSIICYLINVWRLVMINLIKQVSEAVNEFCEDHLNYEIYLTGAVLVFLIIVVHLKG